MVFKISCLKAVTNTSSPIFLSLRGVRGTRIATPDSGLAGRPSAPSLAVEKLFDEMSEDPEQALFMRQCGRKRAALLDFMQRSTRNLNVATQKTFVEPVSPMSTETFRRLEFSIDELDPNRPKDKRVKDLLDNSAGYLDIQTSAIDDPFSTSPYQRTDELQERRSVKDASDRTVLMFPGQGAQFVGMGRELLKYPKAKEMYDCASEILGYGLLKLCLEGPTEELQKTVHCQPATLVTSLAAVEKLRDEMPLVVDSCYYAVGYSVGEYAALTFGDVLKFEDAVKLVKIRAQLMHDASVRVPCGMSSVFLHSRANLNLALKEARFFCLSRDIPESDAVCDVAIHLLPHCKIIGGHKEALRFLKLNADKFGLASVKNLAVSGAFHTSLMAPACEEFSRAVEKIQMKQPNPKQLKIRSNVNGDVYGDVATIKKHLVKQLTHPVHWEQILHRIYDRVPDLPLPSTYECGPGKTLGTTLRSTNARGFQKYRCVPV